MVCLDTTFLIDIIKGRKEVKAIEDDLEKRGEIITVATPSIVELFKGIYLKKNIKYINQNEVDRIIEIISSFNILDLDKESAILAGEIEANLINAGNFIDVEDIMIAAIVKHNSERLITRNIKHFERIQGLDITGY